MITAEITQLENDHWDPKAGPDINNPPASAYSLVPTPAGLVLLMNSFVPYGGWLAKHVSILPFEARRITMHYEVVVDDATAVAAQVIETDAKITDSEGWTYDLSAQWNIAKGWRFQVDNNDWKWCDTNVSVAPFVPLCRVPVSIEYDLDYEAHMSQILSVTVDGHQYQIFPLIIISAKKVGWDEDQIVTQLQQCNNGKPGGYGLRFSQIGYSLAE